MAYKNLATRKASDSYQRELIAARERKLRYRGKCEVCGEPTSGCNGPGKAPRFCATCVHDARARRTPEALIAAIQAWARRFGRPPTASEWNPGFARYYAERHPGTPYADRLLAATQIVIQEDWPRSQTVIWRFGSWRAGMKAAGFEVPPPGRRRTAGHHMRAAA